MFNFFKKIKSPFSKIKGIGSKIQDLFLGKVDDVAYENLERLLFEADIGPKTSIEIADKLKKHLRNQVDSNKIIPFLKEELLSYFPKATDIEEKETHVILVVGINGSGKTTTVAKLANLYKRKGKKVLLAAADTFRAAASSQLETWAEKVSVEIIRSQKAGNPSAVAFDALEAAKNRGSNLVIIDTAGRLQNKTDLMNELEKLRRTCEKKIENAPHETLLVIDATVGQNAIDQVREFHRITPLTGIVLTKLDGSAKGGIAVAIQKEFQIPIRWVGLGESMEDLIPFDPQEYVNGLLN